MNNVNPSLFPRMSVSLRDRKSNSGFTLVEVAIAVALAGIALTTLITLQTRIIATYATERDLTRAALYAQYIMTFVELEAKEAELGTKDGSLDEILTQYGYFDDDRSDDEKKGLHEWRYLKEIEKEDFGLGDVIAQMSPDFKNQEIARRVRLTISWGPQSNQQYTLTFFTRQEKAK